MNVSRDNDALSDGVRTRIWIILLAILVLTGIAGLTYNFSTATIILWVYYIILGFYTVFKTTKRRWWNNLLLWCLIIIGFLGIVLIVLALEVLVMAGTTTCPSEYSCLEGLNLGKLFVLGILLILPWALVPGEWQLKEKDNEKSKS